MFPKRVTDPAVAELRDVEQRLAAGEAYVVQFNDVTYTPGLLAEVDSLAARFGDLLEVRFYGHVSTPVPFTVSVPRPMLKRRRPCNVR